MLRKRTAFREDFSKARWCGMPKNHCGAVYRKTSYAPELAAGTAGTSTAKPGQPDVPLRSDLSACSSAPSTVSSEGRSASSPADIGPLPWRMSKLRLTRTRLNLAAIADANGRHDTPGRRRRLSCHATTAPQQTVAGGRHGWVAITARIRLTISICSVSGVSVSLRAEPKSLRSAHPADR